MSDAHERVPTSEAERAPQQAGPAAPVTSADTVLELQRTAGNQQVQRLLEADASAAGRLQREAPAATAEPGAAVDPMPAINALDDYRIKQERLIDGTAIWQTSNWIDYLDSTSENPSIALADTQIAGVGSNAFGNAITAVGGKLVTATLKRLPGALGAMIGTLAEPGIGTVVGFLVGVVIESAAAWAWDKATRKTDLDETRADTAKRVGRLIQERHLVQAEETQKAQDDLETIVKAAKDNAAAAATQDVVDRITSWAEKEAQTTPAPPPATNRDLATHLLRVWVREHAGDLDSAHGDTSQAQWEQAVEEAFGPGATLENHPEIFAFQTRGEWEKAGLDHAAQSEPMMAQVKELVRAGRGTEDPAGVLRAAFHDKQYVFTAARDAEVLVRYIEEHSGELGDIPDLYVYAIRDGKARIRCTLDVGTRQGSAYIDEWNFEIRFKDMEISMRAFDVWPTSG